MKEVIGREKISSSLALLQKLDLPRERRRRINRKIVICLAAGQAKAFAKLRTMSGKETSQQIIDDFTHSPSSWVGKFKDSTEDLKDSMKRKYHDMSCTFSTEKVCSGRCGYKQQCCRPGPQPRTDGLVSFLSRLGKMIVPYVDLVKDTILVVLLMNIAFFFHFLTICQKSKGV